MTALRAGGGRAALTRATGGNRMKNRKMSSRITICILILTTIGMILLYVTANRSMTSMMKDSRIENLAISLDA